MNAVAVANGSKTVACFQQSPNSTAAVAVAVDIVAAVDVAVAIVVAVVFVVVAVVVAVAVAVALLLSFAEQVSRPCANNPQTASKQAIFSNPQKEYRTNKMISALDRQTKLCK